MSRAGVVVLLAPVLLGAVACGGDDDGQRQASATTTTAVDRDDWSAQLDRACDELNRDYDQLVSADPDSREDAVAYARDVERFAGELVEVLDAAGVPTEDRDDADELAALVDQLEAAAAQLADAAEEGDSAAAQRATTDLEAAGAKINPLAGSLDAPACGGF